MLSDLQKNTGVKVIVVGAAANLVLAVLKIAAGIVGRSTAMVADGIHSLSDLLTDGVVLFAHKIGQLPADQNHPYGHGRAETLGATLVGAVIMVAGLGLAYGSWEIISTDAFRTPTWPACRSSPSDFARGLSENCRSPSAAAPSRSSSTRS